MIIIFVGKQIYIMTSLEMDDKMDCWKSIKVRGPKHISTAKLEMKRIAQIYDRDTSPLSINPIIKQ